GGDEKRGEESEKPAGHVDRVLPRGPRRTQRRGGSDRSPPAAGVGRCTSRAPPVGLDGCEWSLGPIRYPGSPSRFETTYGCGSAPEFDRLPRIGPKQVVGADTST